MLFVLCYLLRRIFEVSTWLGIGVAAPALHILVHQGTHAAAIMQAVAGLAAAIIPEDAAPQLSAVEADQRARLKAAVSAPGPPTPAGPSPAQPGT